MENILVTILADNRVNSNETRRNFARSLWKIRCHIKTEQSYPTYMPGKALARKMVDLLLRTHGAISRRSSAFPKMKVLPLD